jgi:hypothetical protein
MTDTEQRVFYYNMSDIMTNLSLNTNTSLNTSLNTHTNSNETYDNNNTIIIKNNIKSICLAMIVKDESKVIERCFKSLNKLIDSGHLKYWIICDTGSTDGTQNIITNYWKLKNINGELHQHEWKNFGHNRSLLMKLAKGHCDYIITLDADEIFSYENDFVMPNLTADMYHIWTRKNTTEYQRLQLVSDKFDWCYKGVCHEYLSPSDNSKFTPKSTDILKKIWNIPYPDGSRSSDPNKYRRDAFVFETALLDEPNNIRYVYYLAQSYRDCNDYDNAIKYYKKRIELAPGCNSEETYYAQFQIAICKLCKNEPFSSFAVDLLKAFNIRPSRLEAAYIFMKYARENNMSYVAFHTFKHILDRTTLETDDTSFINAPIYKWQFLYELSLIAVSAGFNEDAKIIIERLKNENNFPSNMSQIIDNNYNSIVNIIKSKNMK